MYIENIAVVATLWKIIAMKNFDGGYVSLADDSQVSNRLTVLVRWTFSGCARTRVESNSSSISREVRFRYGKCSRVNNRATGSTRSPELGA